MKNNRFTLKSLTGNTLTILCLLLFTVAVYSILTYGQANIHGDTAIATLLARAEVKYHSIIPSSFAYANGDLWLIDTQLATLPFTVLIHNQPLARMLGSVVMVIAGCAGLIFLDRRLLHCRSYLVSIPVILVFIFGGNNLLMWGNDHILYQASYTAWLYITPVMLVLTYSCLKDPKADRILLLVYIICAIVCYARGIRAAAEVMVPMLATVLLHEQLRDKRIITKEKLIKYFLLVFPMGSGLVIYKVIRATHTVNVSDTANAIFVSSIDDMFQNALTVFKNIFIDLGFNKDVPAASVSGLANLVSFCSVILFIFVIPALQGAKLSEESDEFRFFFTFAVIHNLEMLIATICFFGKTSPSHILTFVILSIMVSSHYMMKYWISSEKTGNIWKIVFICASLLMAAQLVLAGRGWQGKLAEKRNTADILIEHGLDEYKGFGSFWNIYPLAIYSDLKLDVASIGESELAIALKPHKNLVDTNKYLPSSDTKGSYILLDYNQNEELGKTLEDELGPCREKFNIGENFIYVWDHDICDYWQ